VTFGTSPIGMALIDADLRLREVNSAYAELVGHPVPELVGGDVSDVTHPEDRVASQEFYARVFHDRGRTHRIEKRYLRPDGGARWGLLTATATEAPDGSTWLLGQVEDITERRNAEAELRYQALHDALTGLPNRHAFLDQLSDLLLHAGPAQPLVVLFADLDGFKRVNDGQGHSDGDLVLVTAAARLAGLDTPALVARLGGDEFALAAPVADADAAWSLAGEVVRALAEPVEVQGGRLVVTVSVGLVVVGSPYADPTRLLADADTAMYRAKQLGGDRVEVFDTAMRMAAKAGADMESDVRDALSTDGLVVHYQPLVDLRSARLVGLEALVRLRGEQGQLVPPGDFIDVAERTGLVVPLGRQVLETACAQVAAWQRRFGTRLSVTVNVSARQAARPDFVATVDRALHISGLEPSCLGLELTESALLSATPATLAGLQTLRARGLDLGIDDFGTGYASLTYLCQLPITFLKVDRSFARALPTDKAATAVVRAVTGLASELGLTCVVEGIETVEQLRALTQQQLPGQRLYGQGYLLGPPAAPEEIERMLSEVCRSARSA